MQSRALRAISKAVVAAGTAGAITTACWLLNRILDNNETKCIDIATSYLDTKATTNDYKTSTKQQERDADDSFVLLPVVSESDDDVEEDAMGYTADYYTPHYDVCMLSVSVQTLVDPLSNVSSDDISKCRAAIESCDSTRGIELDGKTRTLSFSNTEISSNGSVLSLSSEHGEEKEVQHPRTCSRTQQWLCVQL